jgi:hypothetical protein
VIGDPTLLDRNRAENEPVFVAFASETAKSDGGSHFPGGGNDFPHGVYGYLHGV